MASKRTIEIVKATAPVLQEHGEAITKVFYTLLFEKHPELRDVFNMTHQQKGSQQKVLANAIFQYAVHIDKLEMMGPAVESIAQKHTSLSISKEAYPIVGENLLLAIKEVLGAAATDEIIDAWAEAYGDLAAIFVSREEEIYTEREQYRGGFRGTKAFVVAQKVVESSVITSFYLKRADGTPVPQFLPGQYVALTVSVPGTTHQHTRNYSMSDSSDRDYLRISVKRETGYPEGVVSNYLHDEIHEGDVLELGMPSGEFVWQTTENPSVFISGGIGVTPLLSMYKEAVAKSTKPIVFIQCALNSDVCAFADEIEALANHRVQAAKVYSLPLSEDVLGEHYDFKGYLTEDVLESLGVAATSDFYFCGPTPFMANTLAVLEAYGVAENQINYEFFGPQEELELV